jgi:hypothetical protein
MITHTFHRPATTRKLEIPRIDPSGTCPCCHSPGAIQKTGQCRFCHVWVPSERSLTRPKPSRRKQSAPLPVDRIEYDPQHDPDNWPTIDDQDDSLPWLE